MPVVARDTHGDGDSSLSMPIAIVVCIASVVGVLTLGQSFVFHNAAEDLVTDLRVSALMALGVLTWRFIVWRRDKDTAPTPTSTKFPLSPTAFVHLPRKPEPIRLASAGKGQNYAIQVPSPNPSPPPAYSPRLMKSSPASNKKLAPALSLDVSCDAEVAQPSPLRSTSFNSSAKTQSFGSRLSSRMSMGAKKLYVYFSG